MRSVRRSSRGRRRVRIGAPDPTLTPVAGMIAVTELVERLDVIGRLDAAIGPLKQRRRGTPPVQLLVGIAAAQLAGEDFLVGLDRQRADPAASSWLRCPGWRRRPRPGWPAGSAMGSGRRWRPVLATSHAAALAAWLRWRRRGRPRCAESVTIDLDTTDVEVYGRHKRGWPTTTRASGSAARTSPPGPTPPPCWPRTCWRATRTPVATRPPCCVGRWPRSRPRHEPGGSGYAAC